MKNKYVEIDDETIAIEINYKGDTYNTYIDKQDLDKADSVKGTWHIAKNRTGHIDGVKTKVQINKVRKQIWLHNHILDKEDDTNVIDHIDHNTLNNRRSNLREVSKLVNAQNVSRTVKSKTGIRNVTMEGNRYRVRIKGYSFGSYSTLEEAVKVADRERKKIFPEYSELDEKINITK